MKLVVGLGNPGVKYQRTRHNVGYMVLAELATRLNVTKYKTKFQGECVDVSIDGTLVLLLSPTTFMNRSGQSVAEAARFYKIPTEDVLVVCDDLNLPFGKLRLRAEGSSGGQKGLSDVIRLLGTDKVPRLRIGIGSPPGSMDAADYVLMNFTEKEWPDWGVTIKQAADAVMLWIGSGLDETMNRYNGK